MIVALMQTNGLTNLASNDDDFDNVLGITHTVPVSFQPMFSSSFAAVWRTANFSLSRSAIHLWILAWSATATGLRWSWR